MALIGQWLFEDADAPGEDSSATGNTALFQNGAATSGGAATFAGDDDFIEIPDSSDYHVSEATLAFQFTADSVGGSDQGLVSRDSSGFDSGGHLTITIEADGSLLVRHQSDAGNYYVQTSAGFVTAGQTYDVSYSFGPDNGMELYVDGVLVDSDTQYLTDGADISLSNNTEPWVLGASQENSGDATSSGVNRYLDGQIDYFEIYDQELTAEEIPLARAGIITDPIDDADDGTVDGTEADDIIYGGNDTVSGNDGLVDNDTISAGAGNDTIIAGDGDDTIEGGTGNDSISGGDGDDTITDTGTAVAPPVLIASEDFEGGASGWTDNTTTTDATFSEFLGGFAGTGGAQSVSKTFTLDGSKPAAVVEFDFIRGDSWDNEEFRIFADDNQIFGETFQFNDDGRTLTSTFTSGGTTYDVTMSAATGNVNLGQAGWADQVYKVRIEVDNPNATLKLGFGSTLNQAVNDEFFGIDNLTIISSDDTSASATDLGSTAADIIDGGAGNDIVYGGTGNDTIYGGDGNDRIDGGTGNNVLYGGNGSDSFDVIFGGSIFYGGDDDDTFGIGFSTDTVYGGSGGTDTDTLSGMVADDALTITVTGSGLGTFADDDGDSGVFEEIEVFELTADADTVLGGGATEAITVFAGGGADVITTGSADDSIDGGTGDDTIYGGTGNDRMSGDDGSDIFYIEDGFGTDLIYGGEGGTNSDTLDLSALGAGVTVTYTGDEAGTFTDGTDTGTFFGIESVILTDQDDDFDASNDTLGISVDGRAGNDTLAGGTGNDSLDGGQDNDVLYGAAGNDVLSESNSGSANGNDVFYGGTGNDTITSATTGSGGGAVDDRDILYGGSGDDSLTSGDRYDTLYGGVGDDNIATGNVEQTVYAGAGNDTITGSNESGTSETDVIHAGDGGDLVYSGFTSTGTPETGDMIFGGAGGDTLYGGAARDTIAGGTGADTIFAGDMDDMIRIADGFGSDTIYGGEGGTDSDTLDLSALGTGVTVTYTGDEQGTFTDGTDTGTFFGIENVILSDQDDDFDASNDTAGVSVDGRGGNDTIIGGDDHDTVTGGIGDDVLFGGDGADQIYGGLGSDTLDGSDGFDHLYAGAQNDSVDAGLGTDRVYGGSGDDNIDAGQGQDLVYGGVGNDTLDGESGADTLFGGDGDDRIIAGLGSDTVYGGDDQDTIVLEDGFGSDTIYGGEGGTDSDTLDLSALGPGVTVTYTGDEQGTFTDGTDTGTFFGIENIILSDQNDDLDASNDTLGVSIDGRAGNDTIYGGHGQDLIYGGDGNDSLRGDLEDDTIYGGAGDDTINWGNGDNYVDGGAGNDSITGGPNGLSTVLGGAGNDTIRGGNAQQHMYGGDGDDVITDTGGSRDYLFGGTGNDTLASGNHDDGLYGGTGNDQLSGDARDDLLYDGAGNDLLYGGAGNDTVFGDAGQDQLYAGIGNDLFYGGDDQDTIHVDDGFGTDTIYGGEGGTDSDTLDLSALGAGVTVTYTGDEQGTFTDGTDTGTFFGIENVNLTEQDDIFDATANLSNLVIFGGSGSDSIIGSDFNGIANDSVDDTIYGGTGNDTIDGRQGKDTLYGGDGDDRLLAGYDDSTGDIFYGGAGTDTYQIDGTTVDGFSFDIDLVSGNDSFGNQYYGIENVIGGTQGDSILGDGADNILDGRGGNDSLAGGAGNDTIYGGDGADTIVLTDGFGTDTVYGGEGGTDSDTLDLSALGPGVTVTYTGDEQGTFTDGTDTGTFFGIETVVLTDQDDDFDASNDTVGVSVDGRGGDDTLVTGTGNDSIGAGTGNDSILSDDGNDLLYGGAGDDEIEAGRDNDTIYAGAGNDSIADSYDNDTVYGGAGDDIFDDSYGDDTLYGGAGNDVFDSGSGSDTIYAGDGADAITAPDDLGDVVYGGEGGTDQDELDFGTSDDVVVMTGAESGSVSGGGTFFEIESLNLSTGDDSFDGSGVAAGFTVDGSTGADTLTGGSGGDSLDGGTSSDVLDGGAGNDTLDGGTSDDTLTGGLGNDTLTGGASDDVFVLTANGGDDTITDLNYGGSENDQLETSALSDVGNTLTNQDGTVTADEVTVTGGGGSDQVLTFPNGETVTVPDGTIDTATPAAQFASLVAMGVPPCFAPGTRVLTPDGERPVEDLWPGDLVITADHGPQPIRWIGRREVDFTDPTNTRAQLDKPILIKRGALGNDLPRRDLILSPQHRMAMGPSGYEVLVRAKHLTQLPGIRVMRGRKRVTYYAILLARHEVLFVEGAPAESFRPGPIALAGFSPEHRAQIFRIHPGLADDPETALGPPARPFAGRARAQWDRRGPTPEPPPTVPLAACR